jgi:hypothetical protein
MSATLRQGLLLHEIKRGLNKPVRPHIGEPIPASVLEDWEGNPRGFLAWLRAHTLALSEPEPARRWVDVAPFRRMSAETP